MLECPDEDWVRDREYCYLYKLEMKTFYEAYYYCKSNGFGNIVSIQDQRENDLIHSKFF